MHISTRSSATAEGLHVAFVGKNLATAKHPILKRIAIDK